MTAGVNSMQSAFEKIGEHDDLIHQDILPQLKEIRREQEEIAKEINRMALSQSSLELTVMKDGQQTRELLVRFVDHYFETDDKKLGMNEKFTLKRLSTTEKVVLGFIVALGGSGGILAGIAAIVQMIKI